MIGSLVFVSGPSGVGKDSVISAWKRINPHVCKVVNYSTRPPRFGEENGVSYHFVDGASFSKLADQGAFADHREIFGNWYGIAQSDLETHQRDSIIVANIDVEGVGRLNPLYPEAFKVFLVPPSQELMTERLESRGGDSTERQQRLFMELELASVYDIQIVNSDSAQTAQRLGELVRGRRLADTSYD